MPETLTDFQSKMLEIVQLRADLDQAHREYAEIPELPEDTYTDRQESFVKFRLNPLIAKINGEQAELSALPPPAREKYKAPKLKGLDDIKALCQRNAERAKLEGVGK